MFQSAPRDLPQRIVFAMVPAFSMMPFAATIEPLRIANRLSGQDLYRWSLHGSTGAAVPASNGIEIPVDGPLPTVGANDGVVVVAGVDVNHHTDKPLLAWLRRAARQGASVGAICTGGYVLAKAGLLDGYRCTLHWENIPGFAEEFPEIDVSARLFEVDRSRFTCAGGTAGIDMSLHLIAEQHGGELAGDVAEQVMHERIRDHGEQQRMSFAGRIGVRHPKLMAIIEAMQDNLEEPLDRRDLAAVANLSTRQLERLFRKYLNRSPARYYLELRLQKARKLLLQTNLAVIDVGLACGFVSPSHFTKCYRSFYGRTPYRERCVPLDFAGESPVRSTAA